MLLQSQSPVLNLTLVLNPIPGVTRMLIKEHALHGEITDYNHVLISIHSSIQYIASAM